MTVLVIRHDPNETDPAILGYREEPDDYVPGAGEFIAPESVDPGQIHDHVLDYSTDPPTISPREPTIENMVGVLSQRNQQVLVDQFLAAGTNALAADSAVQSNPDIPQEVKDFNRSAVQIFYLLYVALTGERVNAVEDEYFPVS